MHFLDFQVDEFINHPLIHEGNRNIVKTFLEYEKNGMSVPAIKSIHPVFNKPITTYTVALKTTNQNEEQPVHKL